MNRLILARKMIDSSRWLVPLALMVMRPENIIRYSRDYFYSQENALSAWADEALLAGGLVAEERMLVDSVGNIGGNALVLGTGGGRDAIALAQRGFQTIGVDFVPDMVHLTMTNAAKNGVKVDGVVQEISALGFASGKFNLVFFSSAMYSCTPTKKRRIAMLRRIHHFLREDGFLICQFFWRDQQVFHPAKEALKRLTAFLLRGYSEYERGDFLSSGTEFLHAFDDRGSLFSEFDEGGFEVREWTIFQNGFFGAALLTKKMRGSNDG